MPTLKIIVLILITSWISIAHAQTPPGLINAPPCAVPSVLPSQARVPCVGILLFQEGTDSTTRSSIANNLGAQMRFNYQLIDATAVYITDETILDAVNREPMIKAIIPDRAMHAIKKPSNPGGKGNDGDSDGQTVPEGVLNINAAPGNLSYDGTGVGVAIVDTGIDANHTDLDPGLACFSAFNDCHDANEHGTHVAGIVAALNNQEGVVGVASGATPYAVKVLNDAGSGSDSTVMAGLEWVATNAELVNPNIKVVNMSLGRPGSLNDNPALRALVELLSNELNITLVVAAGNDSGSEVSEQVPATYPEVIAVANSIAMNGTNRNCRSYKAIIPADTAAATTTDGAYNTSSGIGVTISAPGTAKENITRSCRISFEGILSLKSGGGTTRKSGTSMAAPHVAGVAALLIEQAGGTLSPETIRTILRSTASRVGEAPLHSPTTGYSFDGEHEGILSACSALGDSCP